MKNLLRIERGKRGEDAAVQYLDKEGFTILHRNYRFNRGEIDIIAEEGDELVFVEVKTRYSSEYGIPEEAVTEEKQIQIANVAEGYLYETDGYNRICRFDIVAVEFQGNTAELRHIRNAF